MTKARDIADNAGQGGGGGSKNLVINGAMQVAQRGTSSTGLGASSVYFTVDRFNPNFNSTAGRLTMTQEAVTDLDGFTKCTKFACTTADTSIGASEYFILSHNIEGQNLQHLAKGTSSAKKVTLSFYVKGNAAATYVCELQDNNSREISKSFSVTTDWTRVVLTFDGDTNSGGTIVNNNTTGIGIIWWLHAGSTFNSGNAGDLNTSWNAAGTGERAAGADSFFDSTSRTFFITGVQLEVNDKVTDFEHRSYEEEIAKCQRYYWNYLTLNNQYQTMGNGSAYTATSAYINFDFPVQMRAEPTLGAAATNIRFYSNGGSSPAASVNGDYGSVNNKRVNLVLASSRTAGHAGFGFSESTVDRLYFDAEL